MASRHDSLNNLVTSLQGALRKPVGSGGDLALMAALNGRHPAETGQAMDVLTLTAALAGFKQWAFGLVVFLGMFASVNIAGVVGTCAPLLSKRAGFDPALTAGPFETAFQDVVGISIFLSLASVLLRWLH